MTVWNVYLYTKIVLKNEPKNTVPSRSTGKVRPYISEIIKKNVLINNVRPNCQIGNWYRF